MTNLEALQKQQLDAMNKMYAQTLKAATGMAPVETPQSNVSQLESQLAEMQASMQQMMQIMNQQQQMIQTQKEQLTQQSVPAHAQPVQPKRVAEPQPVVAPNEDVYKVSSKLVKPCHSCPFAQSCGMRRNQGINEQCGQEVLANKQIMLKGDLMQARFNFNNNEAELLSNGRVVSVIQHDGGNQNKKLIGFMVKSNQLFGVKVVSKQNQPNSIYTTCTVEILGPVVEALNVQDIPTPEPVLIDEESGEIYLSEEETAQYDAMYSSLI